MSTPSADASTPSPTPKPRSGKGFPLLLILVACVALLIWTYRRVGESSDPTGGWVNTLESSSGVDEKIDAARGLGLVKDAELPAVVPALIKAIEDPQQNPRVRAAVARALGGTGVSALKSNQTLAREIEKSLVKALVDADPEVQAETANALFSLKGAGVKEFPFDLAAVEAGLVQQLDSPNENVRRTSASILGGFGAIPGMKVPPRLVAVLEKDPSNLVRASAASGLTGFSDDADRVVHCLFDGLAQQKDPIVVQQCADSLSRIVPTEAALPEILERLKSPDRVTRARSATLLGKIDSKPETAFPALLAVVKEPGEKPKGHPPTERLADSNISELDPQGEAATAISEIAAKLDEASLKQAVEAIRPMLDDPNINLRARAIKAIGQLGAPAQAILPKLEALQKDDPDLFIKMEAGRIAGVLKAPKDKK